MTIDGEANGVATSASITELCFRARALAQSHPMTETARRYRQTCHVAQRAEQPLADFADWATTALDVGYCLRRTEEDTVDVTSTPIELADESLSAAAVAIATELRTGDSASVTLLPADQTIAALDRLIATELDKRADNVREQLSDADWADLEAYIAWWVVHGYCIRAAEAPLSTRPPTGGRHAEGHGGRRRQRPARRRRLRGRGGQPAGGRRVRCRRGFTWRRRGSAGSTWCTN